MSVKNRKKFHTVEGSLRKLLRDEKTEEFKTLIDSVKNNLMITRSSDPILCLAVKKGNYEAVKCLIGELGANLQDEDRHGQKPLHIAAKNGFVEIINYLLQNGADVQELNSGGDSALYLAVKNGQEEAVATLIEHGANVQHSASFMFNKDMPLHVAAALPNNKILNLLLQTNAEIDALNDDRRTPLHLAALKGCPWNVERLLKCGAKTDILDTGGQTPLLLAAGEDNVEVVRLLCIAGAQLNVESNSSENSLRRAVRKKYINVVRTLLYFGADVNREFSDDMTCLYELIGNCRHKMTQTWGGKAWKTPKGKNHPKDNKISINAEIEMLDTLFAAGVDARHINNNGDTCLHVCIERGCAPVLDYLISYGADCQQPNKKGQTPLQLACASNATTAIALLIQHCAVLVNREYCEEPPDPSANDVLLRCDTYTPLTHLWQHHNKNCIRLLCDAGYTPSSQERNFIEFCSTRRKKVDNVIRRQLLSDFSNPWSLSRIARTKIRACLGTCLAETVAELPIPQVLQDSVRLVGFMEHYKD